MKGFVATVAALLGLLLVGCSDGAGAGKLVSSSQGVYFTDWRGQVFRIEGDKLSRVTAKVAAEAPQVVKFDQSIPAASRSGFPILVAGSLKAGEGVARVRVELSLGAMGERKPTALDQATFVEGLRSGTEKLRSVTLVLYDADGFLAAPHMSLGLSGQEWTAMVNEKGVLEELQYNGRIELEGVKQGDIATVDVQWLAIS